MTRFILKDTAKKHLLTITKEIDTRLITIIEDYKKLTTLQASLRKCDKDDWGKETEKGKLLTSILKDMEGIELKILSNFVYLIGEFEQLCKKHGIAPNSLSPIKLFKPQTVIVEKLKSQIEAPMTFQKLGWKVSSLVIQRSQQNKDSFHKFISEIFLIIKTFFSQGHKGVKELYGLTSVRHLVQYGEDLFDVIGMIQSLIRTWGLVLVSNFDLEEHKFIALSQHVEVEMWVTGNFYEGVSKIANTENNEQETQAKSQESSIIKGDIQDRLKRIDFYFKERYQIRDVMRCFRGHDVQGKTQGFQDNILKFQLVVDNLLHELYHLGDNIKKYLNLSNRREDFNIMENFKPYRWCGNYVNHLKHGSRGKGRPIAIPSYIALCFNKEGAKPTENDNLVDCTFMINIDGRIESGMEIALRLIDMWFQFLKYHSDIDLVKVKASINKIRENEFIGKTQYSAKIPDGILDDAKKQAQERKELKL